MKTVFEPSRQIPVVAEAEVVVLGGGPAGIAAATAAARTGASTILLERYGFLGGAGTAAMVTNFCGLYAKRDGEVKQVIFGLGQEILERVGALGGLGPILEVLRGRSAVRCYDNAIYKCAADDMLLGANVKVMFHALAVGATLSSENTIDAIVVETKSGRGAVAGRVFIDCSGDADLAAWAGAPYEKGDADGAMAFPTLMFRMGHVDDALATETGKPGIERLMEVAEQEGSWAFPRKTVWVNPQPHAGEWRANVTQIMRDGERPFMDGTVHDDLVYAEVEGRKQALKYLAFLKARVPGFKDAYLLELAPQVGFRETRRIVAQHMLSGDEVALATDFHDAIGVNAWPLEQHAVGDVRFRFIEGRGFCQIPYRSLVPRGVTNLLVAGRCAGATREGQAAIRVSGPCFVMGQAAGTAAALTLQADGNAATLDVPKLQAALRRSGVFFGE